MIRLLNPIHGGDRLNHLICIPSGNQAFDAVGIAATDKPDIIIAREGTAQRRRREDRHWQHTPLQPAVGVGQGAVTRKHRLLMIETFDTQP